MEKKNYQQNFNSNRFAARSSIFGIGSNGVYRLLCRPSSVICMALSLFGWVAGIYMLSITIFMPIFGKAGRSLRAQKRFYLISFRLVYDRSATSAGLSDTMTLLLFGRSIQGIGAGGLMPLAMIIIGDAFPLEQRAKVQSLIGPMLILPQLIGPTIGGYFVSHINWHWIFLINIPVGLIAAVFVAKGLHESVGTEKKKIDWAGALTLSLYVFTASGSGADRCYRAIPGLHLLSSDCWYYLQRLSRSSSESNQKPLIQSFRFNFSRTAPLWSFRSLSL